LLPGVVLPLHIFEPRYRAMTQAVMEARENDRLVAMALLNRDYEPLYDTKYAPIHDVVCVGRVIEHERLADGRFNLMLAGCARAKVAAEDRTGPFRRVLLNSIDTSFDLDEEQAAWTLAQLDAILREPCDDAGVALHAFATLLASEADLASVIDILTFYLMPREDCELKQRVLQEPAVSVRANILLRWLRSETQAAKRRRDGARQSSPFLSLN
jgi:Lon protease-like protein